MRAFRVQQALGRISLQLTYSKKSLLLLQRYRGMAGQLYERANPCNPAMEKEHSDGFASLLLLFVALVAVTCYIELRGTSEDTRAIVRHQNIIALPSKATFLHT